MPEVIENIGAGEGNRTLVFSLEGCCSTIELHPHVLSSMILMEKRDPFFHIALCLTRRAGSLNHPRRLCSAVISGRSGPQLAEIRFL